MLLPCLLALATGLPGTPLPSGPRVRTARIEELARFAEAVFIGRVEEVLELDQVRPESGDRRSSAAIASLRSVPIARVRVERPLKGVATGQVVHYLAAPTWICDISGAELGERALFLLDDTGWHQQLAPATRAELKRRTDSAPVYSVAHAGRGRMPLRAVQASEYATFWSEVVLPTDLPSIDGSEEEYAFIRSVHLPSLEAHLVQTLAAQLPYVSLTHRCPLASDRGWHFRVWGDGYGRLVVEDPGGERVVESVVPAELVARIDSLLHASAESQLAGSFGQGGPDGPRRSFEGRTREGRVRFELLTIWPHSVSEIAERRRIVQALELWDELRGLFDEPGTLDSRKYDRACIEAW
jgi:hypothetical protein